MTEKDKFIQEKLTGYHEKPCSYWQRLPYRSDTGGVSPMMLDGLEKYTNHRINGMTPERRALRKQWLLDQNLSHREPVFVPELYRELYNPVRRFIRYPFEKLQTVLTKATGIELVGQVAKWQAYRYFWGVILMYASAYYFLHNKRDWTRVGGIHVQRSKPVIYPGAPGYPFTSEKKLDEFFAMGFNESPLYKSEERIKAEHAKELAQKK